MAVPLSGAADLPLHGGHVPPWLARYMRRLAEAIVEAVVEFYSPRVLAERLADPVWFQAFNNAIGMDWDSSGSTTVTTGILKQVAWSRPELGIAVLGGKGARSRLVPEEARKALELGMIDERWADEAIAASKIAAKTDNVLLGDGYSLYHHSVIVTVDGGLAVIQQGMNPARRMARRYHWLGPVKPVEPSLEPHRGIASASKEASIDYDLTSRLSREARRAVVEIAVSTPPRALLRDLSEAKRLLQGIAPLERWLRPAQPRGGAPEAEKHIPYYRPPPRPPRGLEEILRKIRDVNPSTIEELVAIKGVGPSTLRSLVLVAELVYGVPVSHRDPANQPLDPFRYAYVAGGKDGVPFPFRRDYAEKAIEFLQDIVRQARLGPGERRRALSRLKTLATLLGGTG